MITFGCNDVTFVGIAFSIIPATSPNAERPLTKVNLSSRKKWPITRTIKGLPCMIALVVPRLDDLRATK